MSYPAEYAYALKDYPAEFTLDPPQLRSFPMNGVEVTDMTIIEEGDKPTSFRMNEYYGDGYAFIVRSRGSKPQVWFVGNRKGSLVILRQRRGSNLWYWMDERNYALDENGQETLGLSCIGDARITGAVHRGRILTLTLDMYGEVFNQRFDLLMMKSQGKPE